MLPIYTIIDANIEIIILLLISVTSIITLNSSININVVNDIDIIITNESLNKRTAKNIITADWYNDFQTQIKNVFIFNDRPIYKV